MTASENLPRWACNNKLDAQAMTAWVNAELDRIEILAANYSFDHFADDEDNKWQSDGETPDWAVTMMVIERAIELADTKRDIERLREDLLHLTGHDLGRFLKLPPKKRGGQKLEVNPVAKAARLGGVPVETVFNATKKLTAK